MGARQKLNSAYFVGSLLFAGLAGAATQSWFVFVLAVAVLVALNIYLGEIRPPKAKR